MNTTTKSRLWQILVWLAWFLTLLARTGQTAWPEPSLNDGGTSDPLVLPTPEPLAGLAASPPGRLLFPWWPRFRWRKLALARYQAWQRRFRRVRWAYRRAVWVSRLARLFMRGMIPFCAIVDWLTRTQLRRKLGALPVLYAMLEILDVRTIINRYCPQGKADVDHGTVALVLILNRLTAPRGLYRIADWLSQTALVAVLGIPAGKFNDDRLGRTLERLAPHLRDIWLEIVHRALLRFDIDLRFIFYDLTAFIVHGEYASSDMASFGFAHNTPMNKRKVKAALNTTRDGGVPLDYDLWPGQTADVATVQSNMERLIHLLHRHGYPTQEVVIIGDRANVNDALAFFYEQKQQETGLSYLAGLEPRKKEHQQLLTAYPDGYFWRHPLDQDGYFGIPCSVPFTHEEKQVFHRGLIVLSQPMQRARRRTRARQLRALREELALVAGRIGQRRHRTAAQVQNRASTCLRNSKVGHLMQVWATEIDGQIQLHWEEDRDALQADMRRDGRYLLVTNHATLTPGQMLALYRDKDACEKCFTVCKKDLRVSPIYLHKDNRIEAMLLLHMLALLTYSVLQRQARQHGLSLTTRRIIAALESLIIIETHCWDGSVLTHLTPVSVEQAELLQSLAEILEAVRWPCPRPGLPVVPGELVFHGLSPGPISGTQPALLLPTV